MEHEIGHCLNCGAEIELTRSDRKYCSEKCNYAYRGKKIFLDQEARFNKAKNAIMDVINASPCNGCVWGMSGVCIHLSCQKGATT